VTVAWATLRSLVAGLFRRGRVEADMADEIEFHIETRARDLVARGMSPDVARRTARIEFGSIERYKEDVRGARGLRLFDEAAADLLGGIRALRRAPGFTLAAGLSLALGIGANTLVFSLLDSTVLKPLALPEPERLVAIWTVPPDRPDQLGTSSITRYTAFRDLTRSFDSVAAYNGLACGVKTLGFEQDGVAPERILGQTVSPSMFRTLGVQPILGRTFTDAEDMVDQVAPVVLISHRMWQRRFLGDSAIVGKTITLDRTRTTIIGVMPEGFEYFGKDREFFAPLCLTRAQVEGRTGGNGVIARLKRGVSIEQAQSELEALSKQLAVADPRRHQGFGVRVESLNRANARTFDTVGQPAGDYVSSLSILQGAVGLVLLIACANVAGLLLARGASRRTEIALRMTLGAGRWRVTRQVLTEGLPLAAVGATVGVAIAWAGLKAFVALAPSDFPRLDEAAINLRVLGFTAVVVLVTAALFALVPAMQASRIAMVEASRESSRSATGSVERQRMRSLLVCGQIALALVLLVGAGLMIHSFMRALQNELGVDPSNVLTFDFRLPPRDSFKAAGIFRGSGLFEISPVPAETVERVRQRLQTVPGVQAVAAATAAPFSAGIPLDMSFVVDGRPLPPAATAGSPVSDQQRANYTAVSPGYFNVMRIPLQRGRDFDDHDRADAPYVVIISDAMARKYFPNEDPISQYVRFDFVPNERPRQIVGVVGNTLVGPLQTSSAPAVYVPHVQQGPTFAGPFVYMRIGMSFVLRTAGEPMALVPAVKRAVADVDPTTPIAAVRTVEQSLDDSVRHLRLYMLLLGAFGAVATLLAAVGIYGVMAYSVAERTREFGVRMALGARAADVLSMVLGHAARIVGAGVAIGVVVALFVSRLLQASLFEVTRTDPATYVSVSALLILIALIACAIPARRATSVNPIVALRHE
jgi:putative ABC transport system permease protein